jgi:hypothetical protein
MRIRLGPVVAGLALCLTVVSPGYAASPAEAELKAEIDGIIAKLETNTTGFLKWDGADRIAVRPEGDGAVAEISNARIIIDAHDAQPARVTLDRVEISRAKGPDGSIRLGVVFPRETVVRGAKGEETTLRLKDATAKVVLDARSGRVRETEMGLAGGRLEDKKSGDWLSFGPLSAASKLVGTAAGGWSGPLSFELKNVEFFFPDGPVSGLIERIGYRAESGGPDLVALNSVRDRLDALNQQKDVPAATRLDALLESVSDLAMLFSVARGEMTIERLVVRAPTGEPFVALDRASIGGGLTGLAGDTAALRITMQHQGLTLAPSILDKDKVPQRVMFDIGIEEVETAALRAIIDAARKLRGDADQQQAAQQQMLGAAARLRPVLRLYDLAVDTPDVGVVATAELMGSPLAPKGYTAQGDVAVRSFDALQSLVGAAPFAEYLPLLNEIGATAAGSDGTKRVTFHLTSAPPKWLTINGGDFSPWFMGGSGSGAARALRPAHPVMTGDDVRAVQRALAEATIPAPQNGRYDGATAVSVARFQKHSGLGVNGIVDAATRQKLGIKAEPTQPGGPRRPPPR